MAEDELIVSIDKAFWPRGVVRGLTPALRALGDKHGNIVIAAQPTKGQLLVKGPTDRIEEVKPLLLELIEEHFPDAPVPEELAAGGAGAAAAAGAEEEYEEEEEEEEAAEEVAAAPAPTPTPQPPAPTARAPAAPHRQAAAAPAPAPATPAAPEPPVAGRKRPRPPAAVAPDLLWECMRKSSSFIRRPSRDMKRPFSAEPCNLLGLHARRVSGLSSSEGLDIRGAAEGPKDSIVLSQSHAKASHQRRPAGAVVTMGLSKCPKRGLKRLVRELKAKFYRRDLLAAATEKYIKVQRSFKKKRRAVRSRRASK